MSQSRKLRDPIHGFIELRGRECDILDTPLFQRLRRVSQLAMARLVYPGAVHTRFDHTLGVLSVAGRLCDALGVDPDHSLIIRYAALLHDLGHGPFSHVSETILDSLSTPALERAAGKKDKIHELITQKIILEHSDLNPALATKDREEVARLLSIGLDQRIHRDIISGPLDADKQDYLLRDSYFCGVTYGVYDIDQLHQTLCVGQDDDETALMVTASGVHVLEQFVLAKYYLTTQVYRHKVRLITDNMLVRGIQLGVLNDKIKFLQELYCFKDSKKYLSNYLSWDDQRLTVELLKPDYAKTYAGSIFRDLAERRLFKQLFSINLKAVPNQVRMALPQQFAQSRKELEQAVASELKKHQKSPVDANCVILHLYRIESVRAQSRNSEAPIMVNKPGKPVPFEDESSLFTSIEIGLSEEYLECYAPVSFTDEKQKLAIKEKIQAFMLNFLADKFDNQLKLPVQHEKL